MVLKFLRIVYAEQAYGRVAFYASIQFQSQQVMPKSYIEKGFLKVPLAGAILEMNLTGLSFSL